MVNLWKSELQLELLSVIPWKDLSTLFERFLPLVQREGKSLSYIKALLISCWNLNKPIQVQTHGKCAFWNEEISVYIVARWVIIGTIMDTIKIGHGPLWPPVRTQLHGRPISARLWEKRPDEKSTSSDQIIGSLSELPIYL